MAREKTDRAAIRAYRAVNDTARIRRRQRDTSIADFRLEETNHPVTAEAVAPSFSKEGC